MTENKTENFFGDGVLLGGGAARDLYAEIKALPIVDYHCHLNERDM
ncbi:MAG: glucuronate isomerase [Clostridiales bacterium]|jgi:glucuronate isomerase|nr:glucuronate isomerase [Clostridiales bacterium]